MKRFIIVLTAGLILAFCLTGCNEMKRKTNDCQYEKKEASSIGQSLWSGGKSSNMMGIVNKNSVEVKNQSVDVAGYCILLDEYFYEKNVPFIIYKFVILDEAGNNLTGSQYKELQRLYDNFELELYTVGLGGSRLVDEIKCDSDGKAIWMAALLLNGISDKDKVSKITDKVTLGEVELYFKSNKIATIDLPDYSYDADCIAFDTSSSDSILSIKASEFGVSIIWDLTDKLADFKKMLKNLPVGEDEESYGYTIYNEISITMKDGIVYELNGSDGKNILSCDECKREEDKLASYSVLWKEDISIQEISCITIDGVQYYVIKNNETE